MILVNDRTIIESIIKETKSWQSFDEYNEELRSCIDADTHEKREIFINYLMRVGEKYKKNFEVAMVDLRTFEKFLFLNEKYRDHVLHTFRVWGLGLFLYQKLFKQYFSEDENFHFQWYLAATFHDVGYPLANVNKTIKTLNNNFDNIGIKIGIKQQTIADTNLNSEKIIRILKEICPNKNFNGQQDILEENHGLLSARILLFLLYDRHESHWDHEAKKSIKSIISHNSENEISLKDDPLSALLVICDELQEWDRQYSWYSKYTGHEVEYISIEIKKNGTRPKIEYNYPYKSFINEDKETEKITNLKRISGITVCKRKMKND